MGRRTGRSQNPISWDGPLANLGHSLRGLRQKAGMPTYRAMSARVNYCPATLAGAADGRTRPTWGATEAFARACYATDEQFADLRLLWEQADAACPRGTVTRRRRREFAPAGPPSPPGLDADPRAFIRQLRSLRGWAGNPDPQEISRRSGTRLPPSTMYHALSTQRTRLPSRGVTLAIVTACAPEHVGKWLATRAVIEIQTKRGPLSASTYVGLAQRPALGGAS